MLSFVKRISRSIHVGLGVMGFALCLIGFMGSDASAEQPIASVTQEDPHDIQIAMVGIQPKLRSWTVLCQREDGSQGIFKVTSSMSEEVQAATPEPKTGAGGLSQETPSGKVTANDVTSPDPDPFEDTSLKCARLLTLLAIFATADSPTP